MKSDRFQHCLKRIIILDHPFQAKFLLEGGDKNEIRDTCRDYPRVHRRSGC